MTPDQVSVRVLGRVRVVAGGVEVELPARKVRQLVAALVAAGGRRSRLQLVCDLWGDVPPRSADKVLQQYVSQLRRTVPGLPLNTTDNGYALTLEAEFLDTSRFETLVASGRHTLRAGDLPLAASLLRRALALWDGPAFEEFAQEEFVAVESIRLENLRQDAIEDRLEAELGLGRHHALRSEMAILAAAEPLRERLQGLAMLASYRAGRQGEALDIFRSARDALVRELGVEPGAPLRELQRRILQQDELLALTALPDEAGPLPAAVGALRGRTRELAELHRLVGQDDVRLLVLTGPGGSGKSRLALEVARAAAADHAHGCALLELSSLRDPAQLAASLCTKMGVARQSSDALDDLATALRPRETLLLLDNFEQLRSAGPDLVTLLQRTSGLRLLVTSRVVLHLSGEHVYPVDPLQEDDATALLLERAREAGALTGGDPDTETIRRICRRLDGLPLALELAAPRLRTLTPAELLTRLEARLPVLAGGAHDLPARQQTLRATLQWSHDLLADEDQRALARLAVFPAGCTLAGAEAVCDVTVEALSALVDHNLVKRTFFSEGSRYTMLETVREFALDLLADASPVRRRHAEYTLGVALTLGLGVDARGTSGLQGHAVAVRLAPDLHAALDWSEEFDPELGLRLAVALEQFWITTDPREGVRRFERLLERAGDVPRPLAAAAYRDLGGSVEVSGDWQRAEQVYLHSLRLFEELDDPLGTLALQHRLANMHLYRDEVPAARAATEAALGVARQLGSGFLEADLLGSLSGVEHREGNTELAHRLQHQALDLHRSLGGWPWGEVISLANLAEMSVELGSLRAAEAHGRECLHTAWRLGDPISIVLGLGVLTTVALAAELPARAGVLWGAIEAEERRTFLGRWSLQRDDVAEKVRARGCPALEEGQRLGHRMTLMDAVLYAQTGTTSDSDGPQGKHAGAGAV